MVQDHSSNNQPAESTPLVPPPPPYASAPPHDERSSVARRLYLALGNFEASQRVRSNYTYQRCGLFSAGVTLDLGIPASLAVTGVYAGSGVAVPLASLLAAMYAIGCLFGNIERTASNRNGSCTFFTYTRFLLGACSSPTGSYEVSQEEYAQILDNDTEVSNLLTSWSTDIETENATVQLEPFVPGQSVINISTVEKMKTLIANIYQKKYNEPILGNAISSYGMGMRMGMP